MKINLRLKLLVGFAVLLVLSFSIIAFIYITTKNYTTNQVQTVLLEKARSASAYSRNFFSMLEIYHYQIEKIYRSDNPVEPENTLTVMRSIIDSRKFIRSISLVNDRGIIAAEEKAADSTLPTPPFSTSYLTEIAKSGKTAYSPVYHFNDRMFIDIYYPLNVNTKNIGILKMQIDLHDSWNILSQIRLGIGGLSYVVDGNGQLIIHPDISYMRQAENLRSRPVIMTVLQSTQTDSALLPPAQTEYINEKNIRVVAQATKLSETGWVVVFEQPVSEAYAFLNFTRNLIFVTGAISVVLLLIIAYILANNLSQPISILESYAIKLGKGEFDKPIKLTTRDELETLADTFNIMADKIILRENDLRAEKKQMETMIHSLSDGVVAVNQNNEIILFNPSAENMIGITTKDALGKRIDQVIKLSTKDTALPIDNLDNLIDKLGNGMLFIRNIKDRLIPTSVRLSKVITSDGKGGSHQEGWIFAVTDRTKELEVEAMKVDFVATAAHELRTPLTVIMGYAQILTDEEDKLSDDGKNGLKRLITSGKNLGRIINNILDTSNIEKNMFMITPSKADIVAVIKDAIADYAEEASSHKQTIDFLVTESALPKLQIDSNRMKEVIGNLVANAIHFSPDNSRIEIKIEIEDKNMIISVADQGIGIPPEAVAHLFTKFYRVAKAIKEGTKGPGLGLFISKAIIDLHKGKIWTKSEAGKGSVFYVSLPLPME